MLCYWHLLWAEEQNNHGHFWLHRTGWKVGWPDCIASLPRAGSESSRAVQNTALLGVLPRRGCTGRIFRFQTFNKERPCWFDLSAQHPSPALCIVLFNEVSEVFIKFLFLCFSDYTLEFSRQHVINLWWLGWKGSLGVSLVVFDLVFLWIIFTQLLY